MLRPLFDADASGWFVYGHDDRLEYVNPSLQKLLGVAPKIGSTAFVLDVMPEARESLRRVYRNVQTGFAGTSTSVVPVLVKSEPRAMTLVMARAFEDGRGGPSLLGVVSPLVVARNESGLPDRTAMLERVVNRIVAEVAAALSETTEKPSTPPALVRTLSDREAQVLDLILQGQDPPRIAAQLHLSIHTVRNHIQALFRRLGVHSQVELIAMCRSMISHPTAHQPST